MCGNLRKFFQEIYTPPGKRVILLDVSLLREPRYDEEAGGGAAAATEEAGSTSPSESSEDGSDNASNFSDCFVLFVFFGGCFFKVFRINSIK